MPLRCESCGHNEFRLRRAKGGADAECTRCGATMPNSVLRAATRQPVQGGDAVPPVSDDQIWCHFSIGCGGDDRPLTAAPGLAIPPLPFLAGDRRTVCTGMVVPDEFPVDGVA
jgi:hypothetical protein